MFWTSEIHQHRCCVMENRILSRDIHTITGNHILFGNNNSNGLNRLFRLENKIYNK